MIYRQGRDLFDRIGPIGRTLIYGYVGIGAVFAFVSFLSNMFYYAWGPGAPWWNISALGLYAFVGAGIGFTMGVFGALLRVFLWPLGLWMALSANEPFHRWLLFPWFEPTTISSVEPKDAVKPNDVETKDDDAVTRLREMIEPITAEYQVAIQRALQPLVEKNQQIASLATTELTDPALIRSAIREIENAIQFIPVTHVQIWKLTAQFEQQVISSAERAGLPDAVLDHFVNRVTVHFTKLSKNTLKFVDIAEQRFINHKYLLDKILERQECIFERVCSEKEANKFSDVLRDFASKEANTKMELEKLKRLFEKEFRKGSNWSK